MSGRQVMINQWTSLASPEEALAILDRELRDGAIVSVTRSGPEAWAGDWLGGAVSAAPEWRPAIVEGLFARIGAGSNSAREVVFALIAEITPAAELPGRLRALLSAGGLEPADRNRALRALVGVAGREPILDTAWLRSVALDDADDGSGYALWLAHAPDEAAPYLGRMMPRCSPSALPLVRELLLRFAPGPLTEFERAQRLGAGVGG